MKRNDAGASDALARYLGDDFEVYERPSGIVGVRRKALTGIPDYGTTITLPLTCRINGERANMDRGIPQGNPVPY